MKLALLGVNRYEDPFSLLYKNTKPYKSIKADGNLRKKKLIPFQMIIAVMRFFEIFFFFKARRETANDSFECEICF